MFWPCETRTSICRNLATISSGLYRFLAIAVLLDVTDIPQVGPLHGGGSMPLMPESDMGATPVEGETGKLKYFDIPCSRNSRPTMMRKTLRTRGDHVARKLSIAGIIISPMNALRLCQTPVKPRTLRTTFL